MHWKPRSWILIGVLLTVITAAGVAQVATTQVADTIYHADGTVATGTVLISWPAFTTSNGDSIPSGSTSAVIAVGGTLSVQLIPNAGSTPIGSYYTAVFHLDDSSVSRQYWVVPVSLASVKISAIESTVLPTTVAMQTVSKSYVDTAIAAAVTGHPLDSTPYVLKAGDTMTGPLVLPADPVSATQAADKNYVDESVAATTSGLGQKVSTLPSATQVVAQPTGTQFEVNILNGVEYASQYVNGHGSNGIANAVASADCTNGCEVKAEQDYTNESYSTTSFDSQTHLKDARGGRQVDSYKNPLDVVNHGLSSAEAIDDVSTQSEASLLQQTGNHIPGSMGLAITQEGLAGGSNLYPETIDSPVPYFKMGYSALTVNGTYNTQGQHVLVPEVTDCFGVGDCLIGSRYIYASGGFRDSADEGSHLYDLQAHEDSRVFVGTCTLGCTAGSTTVMISQDSGGGTQGDGRFLIDTNPSKTITSASTGGVIVGGANAGPHAAAYFSGTNLPLSVFLSTGQVIPSQANNMAPGVVTIAIATTGMPSGYAANTSAIGASSGLACVVDQTAGYAPHNFEMARYSVVDATHLQLALNKPHQNMATMAFGGLCGYGLEQTIDTTSGIRQLFPVIGAYSVTGLYYAGGLTPVVGVMNSTSGFLNMGASIASLTRSGNVVSATLLGNLPEDVTGLSVTIAGVADSSYNGNYILTATGINSFTYAQSGANSSSTGGTISLLTGGFALYPMAEVLSVYDTSSNSVDGQMTLAPNNVVWAANDPVEEPHYYQENVAADTEYIGQSVPRPLTAERAGLQYQQNNGPGLTGWSIANASPTQNYLGYGGTHGVPTAAYEAIGIWQRTMNLTAGEEAVFTVHCNLHGCGNWNSGYALFELDSSVGGDIVSYSPTLSSLTLNMRGTPYSFSPQAFAAGTINVGTLNAATINGSVSGASISSGTIAAAYLPLFGPSGSTHAPGIVPDPGATSGSTRFLREDGTWMAPSGGGSGTITAVTGTAPVVSSGGAAPAISMLMATASVDGYLAHTDWNTFNGKQAALGYTPLNPANNLSDVQSVSSVRSNLGLGSAALQAVSYFQTALGYTPAHSGANSDITSLSGLTTALSAAQGGTGLGTLTPGSALIGAGTGGVTFETLAGSGAGLTTGPVNGVTSGDLTNFIGTGGQIADSGIAASNVPLLNATNVFTKLQTININATSPPAAIGAGTVLHLVGVDGTAAQQQIDGFGQVGQVILRRAQGTNASPTALTAGTSIGSLSFTGYDGTAWGGNSAGYYAIAFNNWTTSDHSSYLRFYTTPGGSTTIAEVARISDTGGLSVGNATFNATDPGQGNIAAQGSLIASAAASTSGTGQVSYGGTTAAASNCNQSGVLTSVAGCLVINVAGTTHYVPYF